MTALRQLLDNSGVAAALGVTPRWWRAHKAALYARGFPGPLPGFETRGLHDPIAIARWLDRQRPDLFAGDDEAAGAGDTDLDGWADRLDANARQQSQH